MRYAAFSGKNNNESRGSARGSPSEENSTHVVEEMRF